MSHRLPADQFVVGLVLNVLVLGLVGFLASEIEPESHVVGRVRGPRCSPTIPLSARRCSTSRGCSYLVYPLVPLIWWLLYRTRWGLEVRAVGEDPQRVRRVRPPRQQAAAARRSTSPACTAGLGGGYFLFARSGRFEDSLIGGRGLHRHRRGDLRRLDAEGHGRRVHPVRPRRLVRAHDPVARLQQSSTRRSWRWPRTS